MDYLELTERLDRIERLLVAHKEVLTFEEASEYAGISRSYLYKLTASKDIPHSKPNGKMIFFEKKNSTNGYFEIEGNQIRKLKEKPWTILSRIESSSQKNSKKWTLLFSFYYTTT